MLEETTTRSERRLADKERSKIEKDLKAKGLNDEQIAHYFFVKDSEQKAQEVFLSMQKMINKLGFYLKPSIERDVTNGTIYPNLSLGTLPLDRFNDLNKSEEVIGGEDEGPPEIESPPMVSKG